MSRRCRGSVALFQLGISSWPTLLMIFPVLQLVLSHTRRRDDDDDYYYENSGAWAFLMFFLLLVCACGTWGMWGAWGPSNYGTRVASTSRRVDV